MHVYLCMDFSFFYTSLLCAVITYAAFWLLFCNSFVYCFSVAWVEHRKTFLSTKEPPALIEESLFYLNQSNKIQTAFLSLPPPNAHILSSSYRTI